MRIRHAGRETHSPQPMAKAGFANQSVRNIRSSRCLEDQPTCPRLQPLRPYGGQTARRGGRSGGSPKVETAIGVFEKQYRPENTGTDSPNWVSENIIGEQAISQQDRKSTRLNSSH